MKSVLGLAGLAVVMMASTSTHAASIVIDHQISAVDNLYYTDWGHWWTGPTDGDRLVASNPDGALNDGAPANFVSFNNAPFSFTIGRVTSVNIAVSGSVHDYSPEIATDANGCYVMGVCRATEDPVYKNLPAYSVIGLWSTTYDYITPVKFDSTGKGFAPGDEGYDAAGFYSTNASPFFVGTNLTIDFASIMPSSVEHLYLFLAENDGGFSDNPATDFYSAVITVSTNEVPLPPAVFMLGSGLLTLLGVRARRG